MKKPKPFLNPCFFYPILLKQNALRKGIQTDFFTKSTIVKYIKETNPDFILDFHEAYYFHRRNPNSYGSYLITANNCSKTVDGIAKKCKSNINKFIKENYKKWDITTLENHEGSLRNYARLNNIDYLLIETVGQRNMDKLENRVKINLTIIKTTLTSFNMI